MPTNLTRDFVPCATHTTLFRWYKQNVGNVTVLNVVISAKGWTIAFKNPSSTSLRKLPVTTLSASTLIPKTMMKTQTRRLYYYLLGIVLRWTPLHFIVKPRFSHRQKPHKHHTNEPNTTTLLLSVEKFPFPTHHLTLVFMQYQTAHVNHL